MKYRIKIDMFIRLILVGTILMFVPLYFVVPVDEVYILVLSTVLIAVIVIPLFYTTYELAEIELIINVYLFKKKIKYEDIKSIRKCQNWLSSSAMSKERVEITQHHKMKLLGTTYISPQNREEFFTELKRKCLNLDSVQGDKVLDLWDE